MGTRVFFADPHSPAAPTKENIQRLTAAVLPPKARTRRAGPPRTSRPSLTHSTTGPEGSSGGAHSPRSSRSNYAHSNDSVLHRPIEFDQYTSVRWTNRLAEARREA